MSNKILIKRGTGVTPTLENGEIAINLENKTLSVGNGSENINFADTTKQQELLDLKQNKSDVSLTTTSKTVVGAINELKSENVEITKKLPKVTRVVPPLGSGLSAYDDTVKNEMVVDENGFVTYNFCVTGGKSADNIVHGATLCTIPSNIPIDKIHYDVVNLETNAGKRRLAMAIVSHTARKILLYFIGEETNVSSAKGTITWQVGTP